MGSNQMTPLSIQEPTNPDSNTSKTITRGRNLRICAVTFEGAETMAEIMTVAFGSDSTMRDWKDWTVVQLGEEIRKLHDGLSN